MKYIRTEDGIYENKERIVGIGHIVVDDMAIRPIARQADHIEDLCDRFVTDYGNDDIRILKSFERSKLGFFKYKWLKPNSELHVYGAIWTSKGLIYVAEMNKKGVLELL